MFEEGTLHLERPDPVPGTLDHVIVPPDKPVIPVLIDVCLVPGIVEVAPEDFARCLGIVQIPVEEPDRPGIDPDRNPPGIPRCNLPAVIVVQFDLPSGRRFSHRSGTGFHTGEGPDHQHELGLAVSLVNRQTGPFLPDPDHLGIEGFARTHAVTERGEIELLKIREDQHPVYRGRGTKDRDLVFLKDREELGRLEPPPDVIYEDAGTLYPGPEELPPGRLGPAGIGIGEVEIVWFQV
ncbi:MAG: hypothetical protein BWY93_02118 [Euryarchaeota archaeon ADurb.BinA087]|nr:MAG: hypothetical protein BWY93_02118 [Euryarchaeota archaeon ADurb.BinA087]